MLHKGHDVWISDADGRRINEYNMETEGTGGTTVACYIPSESGKRFVINWKDYNGQHHANYKCSLDGKFAGASISPPNSAGSRPGVLLSADTYGSYQFADLRTTDDETALWAADAASLEKVGTIEVRVVRIRADMDHIPFRPGTFDGVGAVHERSKKLGAHCATLGERVKSRAHGMCKSYPLYPHEGSYATFIFRYRPSALLQAQGIMPPPEPAFGGGHRDDKGKARAGAHDAPHVSPSLKSSRTSKGKKVKPEPDAPINLHAGPSTGVPQSQDVIELSDDDDVVDRKPVIRARVKPERVKLKADPDDVIDLTLEG
ncbi:hypothetical protein C2E23DRAFT_730937 [Lenzites betulinus]|nr:hypothetical protein C2E23DRAFT_730937 [Lenzites betulinus]